MNKSLFVLALLSAFQVTAAQSDFETDSAQCVDTQRACDARCDASGEFTDTECWEGCGDDARACLVKAAESTFGAINPRSRGVSASSSRRNSNPNYLAPTPGCNCSGDRLGASCEASISKEGEWIKIRTEAATCVRVYWFADGLPNIAVVSDGLFSSEWTGSNPFPELETDYCRVCEAGTPVEDASVDSSNEEDVGSRPCELAYTCLHGREGTYRGACSNGVPSGTGRVDFHDGNIYTGMFRDGYPNGFGMSFYPSGTIHAGHYKDDEENGQGTTYWYDGYRYDGEYKAGRPSGNGRLLIQGEGYIDGIFSRGYLIEGKGYLPGKKRPCRFNSGGPVNWACWGFGKSRFW